VLSAPPTGTPTEIMNINELLQVGMMGEGRGANLQPRDVKHFADVV